MSSSKYWQQREEEALKHYITEEDEYDRQIKEIYQAMYDACQQDIDSFYSKYASKEGISIAEAQKRVSKLDIAEYERKAKRYVEAAAKDRELLGKTNYKGFYFSKEANDEMRLYNATMRINRMEMLKSQIGLELLDGHSKINQVMGDALEKRAADELKRQAGILGKTVLNNAQKAHAIPNASFHNATFSQRIWAHQQAMKADISKLLQQGLIQGKGSRELAKDLRKYYIGEPRLKNGKSGARYRTETLMRTELARVQTEAQRQSFDRNGFDQYEFITNSGCCEICRALDGQHFKVRDMLPGLNAPPMHPRCRCSVAAYADGTEYEAWLDYLGNGGSTAEWNAHGRTEWENSIKKSYGGLSSKIGGKDVPEHDAPKLMKRIDYDDNQAVAEELTIFENNAIKEKIETACIITKDGEVFKCFGTNNRVFPDYDLGEKLYGAIVSHNHPKDETAFSLSDADLQLFMDYNVKVLRGCDEKYTYEFTRNSDEIDDEPVDWMNYETFEHASMIIKAKKYGVGYRRWLNEQKRS